MASRLLQSSQEMFRWTGEAKSSGWNEVLDRASKQPGSNVRKNRDLFILMPAKKRNGNGNSSGIGSMSAKQLKRKKPINTDAMVDIKPLTKESRKIL